MRIFNKKLANRIKDNELALTGYLRKLTRAPMYEGYTSEMYHADCAPVQARIDADVATLASHGYDRKGNRSNQ